MKSNLLRGAVAAVFLLLCGLPTCAQTTFQEIISSGVPTGGSFNISIADFNGDGFFDLLLLGTDGNAYVANLYQNQNGLTFTNAATFPIPTFLTSLNAFWADENGDGLLDFILTGTNSLGTATPTFFLQNTDHTFTSIDSGLIGQVVAWMDLDNDGKLDVLVNDSSSSGTAVFWKEADGSYSRTGLSSGRFLLAGDLDGDGDLDVVAITSTGFETPGYGKIFRNDGGRHFADTGVAGFFSYVADFNDDGRLDLVGSQPLSGLPYLENMETDVFLNRGSFLFQTNSIPGSRLYEVKSVGDFDGDGSADLLLFTTSQASGFAPSLVLNTNGGFVASGKTFSPSLYDVYSIVTADFDGDGDLDFVTSPRGESLRRLARNNLNVTRTLAVPRNLASRVRRDRVDLSWEGADPRATSYNLRVGKTPGASDVVSCESLPSGKRLVSRMGNAQTGSGWHIDRLKPGTYYWSVQAVDWGFRGSAFATEMSFTVSNPGPPPPIPTLSFIENVVTDEDTPVEFGFSIGPAEGVADLQVTAESSNIRLVPPMGLKVSGTGANRVLRIEPGTNQNGVGTVTLRVTDLFGQSSTNTFYVSVLPVNDPPFISEISDQFVYSGAPDLVIPFTVSDLETGTSSRTAPFTVTAISSNTNLVPAGSLLVSSNTFLPIPIGSASRYTLTVRIPPTKVGSATITLSTSDGTAKISRSFVLVVAPAPFKPMGAAFGPAGSLSPLVTADFNNDGQMDVLAGSATELRIFQGSSTGFVQSPFAFKIGGSLVAADFNNDNFVDVLSVASDQTVLYLNQKGTNFTTNVVTTIAGLLNARVQAADLDSDGDLDLLILGTSPDDFTTPIAREYLNDGGTWRSIPPPFPGIYGNFALTDLDGDGQMDCVFAGSTTSGASTNGVLRGVGGGRFAYKAGSSADVPLNFGGLADFDLDGVMDLHVSGQTVLGQQSFLRWTDIYRGQGMQFVLSSRLIASTNLVFSKVLGDLDNDGLPDLLYVSTTTGTPGTSGRFELLRNEGDVQFSSLGNPFFAFGADTILAGDMNNDGALDVIGQSTNQVGLIVLTNAEPRVNAVPGVPGNLRAERIGDTLKFSWDAPGDLNQTRGLTYNVRVGAATGAVNVVSPLSLANGKRLVTAAGNTGSRLSLTLTNLTRAKYFWSVQAVDNSFAGGSFAPEQSVGFDLPGNKPPTVVFSPTEYVGGEDLPGTITLTINDDTTPVNEIRLRVFASDPGFLSFTNFTVTGTNAIRTVQFKPPLNRSGRTDLIVQAIDGSGATSTNVISLTITNINDRPFITSILDQYSDGPGDPVTVSFSIGDVDDMPETLKLSALSGNEDVMPSASVVFGGTGTNRTATLQTSSSLPATFPVTIQVTDPGGAFSTTSFQMAFTNRIFKKVDASFLGVYGSMAWGDVDNDGDLDVVVSGSPGTVLYLNNGDGSFTASSTHLPASLLGSVEWGDFDNDGNLDLVVAGIEGDNLVVTIFSGDGHGNLTNINAGMAPLYGPAQFGDFNNDGLPDVLSTGNLATGVTPLSALYLNQKTNFVAASGLPIAGFYGSSEMFIDFDMDGRLDLLLRTGNGLPVDTVFLQTSDGGLRQQPPWWTGWLVAWADFDNDGWPDALVADAIGGLSGPLRLQRNRGGILEAPGTVVAGWVQIGSAVVGDYDNDGFLDFLVTASAFSAGGGPRLFHNEHNGTFAEVTTSFPYLQYAHASWADFDRDGDLDVIVAGDPGANQYTTQLFRNGLLKPKSPPDVPVELRARQTAEGLWIEWDAKPGQAGSTYNVAVGTAPGKWDVLAPMSATNGWRKVAANGNAGWRTSKLIRGLETGKTYYYTVQTVDNAFRGSAFAPEASVRIEALPQLAVSVASTGAIECILKGEANREYVIEVSADLEHWLEFGRFKDPTGQMLIGNLTVPNTTVRFVRARGMIPAP